MGSLYLSAFLYVHEKKLFRGEDCRGNGCLNPKPQDILNTSDHQLH